jgi:hypothetical protein
MKRKIANDVPLMLSAESFVYVWRETPPEGARASRICPKLSRVVLACGLLIGSMDHALSRLLTASALVVLAGVVSVTACTHTTDRVVEPVGGADASTTTPEVGDAGITPIGPIAHPVEPDEDFRLVRAPEFGIAREAQLVGLSAEQLTGLGGTNAGGAAGFSGSDLRPVASGGNYY